MAAQPDIHAVSIGLALAVTTDGQSIPITNWFIGDGGDCPCGPYEADQAVAGPDSDGKWYRIDLSAFTERTN